MSLLTIRARMYVNLGVLATAMLLVCGIAVSAFSDSSRRMQQLHAENLVPITQINEIYQRSLQSQQYRLEGYVHRDPAFTQENYAKVKENRARINELTEQFAKYPLTDEERSLLEEVKQQRAAIVDAGKKEIEALSAGDYDAATKVRIGEIEPVIDRMDQTTEKLALARQKVAEDVIAEA